MFQMNRKRKGLFLSSKKPSTYNKHVKSDINGDLSTDYEPPLCTSQPVHETDLNDTLPYEEIDVEVVFDDAGLRQNDECGQADKQADRPKQTPVDNICRSSTCKEINDFAYRANEGSFLTDFIGGVLEGKLCHNTFFF